MFDNDLKVGIGDMKFTRNQGRVVTYALGSCIGVTFYDPMIRLGALLHVMLPNKGSGSDLNPFKYADAGIHETIRKMTAFGMMKSRTVVKIAGGAKMFEISGKADFGNIGQRNIMVVKQALREEGLRIAAEDTGGTCARTMFLDVGNGSVMIRAVGKPERYL